MTFNVIFVCNVTAILIYKELTSSEINLDTRERTLGLRPSLTSKKPRKSGLELADREGFEPSVRFRRTHDFQSCAFDHSAIYPTTRDN